MAGGGITAILLSYKRNENIRHILQRLRASGLISEAIIWNNNPEEPLSSCDAWVTVINSGRNFKAYARYAAAMLASQDVILFQDDDVVIDNKTLATMYRQLRQYPGRIYGVVGRNLENGRYNGKPAWEDVDIVLGQVMLFSKELLASVYGDMLKLAPIERGDDIAFSLLTGRKHMCRPALGGLIMKQGDDALWKHADHFRKRQEMVDSVLALKSR